MANSSSIKQLADKLDIPYNTSWSDEDIFASIADQIGFKGYDYSESSKEKLFSALKDMERAVDAHSKPIDYDDYEQLENTEQIDGEEDEYDGVDDETDSSQNITDENAIDGENELKDEEDKDIKDKESKDDESTDDELTNDSDDNSKKSDEEKTDENQEDDTLNNSTESDRNNQSDNTGNNNNVEEKESNDESDETEDSNELKRSHSNKQQQNVNSDNTDNNNLNNAQKNLEYNKRRKNGDASDAASNVAGDKVKDAKKAADGVKNAAKSGGKKAVSSVGKSVASGLSAAGNFIKSKVLPFLVSHPWVILIILGVIFVFAIILIVLFTFSGNGKNAAGIFGTGTCNYNLSGIVSNGSVELNSIKVELVNCDATESNYTVLGTVDFEKYVLGTALAEIGESSADEAIKAQIIAVRNFALTRNRNMCPANTDDCFYGYNPNSNVIRMRACEADQVYWDYTEDIYRLDRGSISLYTPEASSENGTLWKHALSDERKKEVEALAQSVKGKVLLDQNGDVMQTPYDSSTSEAFFSGASAGKSYEELLNTVYGSNNFSSAVCSSVGNIDYGDYELVSPSSQTILKEPLADFLEKNGTNINEFNSLIYNNVKEAGYGTRAGVVASAVTLIAELGNKYNVRVPYFWGGGHNAGHIDLYANGTWGSSKCRTRANGLVYDHCGLDCSGFVPWAIFNGGYNLKEARLAHTFKDMEGAEKVQLNGSTAVLQPGDLMESSSHVVLVVAVDETTKEYICAEASGLEYGVWFLRRSFNEKGYYGVKMDNYYNNPNNIRGDQNE